MAWKFKFFLTSTYADIGKVFNLNEDREIYFSFDSVSSKYLFFIYHYVML